MKRPSPRELEKMHETAAAAARWRARLGWLVPSSWLNPNVVPASGIHGRRLSAARMELEPTAPAKSWADWEISRRGRPAGRASEQREG
jgi:hypothetical protein